MAMFGSLYDVAEVRMSIYQPRRENVSTWSISADELMAWAEKTVKPRAQMAFKGEGEFVAGAWCQFCRASPRCRARAEAQLSVAQEEFRLPPVLTDEEIAYYVDTYQPFDKAGAYGIQEWIGYVAVTRIEGSYFNVMGLPIQRLYTELKKYGNLHSRT
jgi:predicted house-cleaning NTP pyrophosphatase (Maf/HAM1 superfamily)